MCRAFSLADRNTSRPMVLALQWLASPYPLTNCKLYYIHSCKVTRYTMISLKFSGTLEKCKVITWNLYLEQCASTCQCHSVPVKVSVLLLLLGSLWKLLKLSPSGLVRKEHSNERATPARTCKKQSLSQSIYVWMEEKCMEIWGLLLQLTGPKYWEENIFKGKTTIEEQK